jgi:hypothetical protein
LVVVFSPLSASFTPLKALDPALVSQLKETLPAALFDKLNGSLSIDQDRLKLAEYKNRVLEERLRLVGIDKYGPGSEKLSDAQLELLELEPGVSSAEVKAESERDQLKLPLKPRRKHPGRQELPANLPRRKDHRLYPGTLCLRELRPRKHCDRLREERAPRREAGRISRSTVGDATILSHLIPLFRRLVTCGLDEKTPPTIFVFAAHGVIIIQVCYWLDLYWFATLRLGYNPLLGHIILFLFRFISYSLELCFPQSK